MASKTDTVINYVSQAIVNVKQQCLASAAAAFALKIKNADKVVINGLTSNNEGSTSTTCSQSSDVEVQAIYGNLQDILNTAIAASPSQANMKKTFIATLSSAINVNVVTTCFSNALAAVQLDITAKGVVTFDNVQIHNRATSTISSCIQTVNVHVGGKAMSMKEYVDANVGWMSSVSGAEPPKKPVVAPVKSIFYCPKINDTSFDVDLLIVWILTVLFGLAALGRIVYVKL